MSAEFSIHVDPSRDLVRIEMRGLFEPEDVQRFLRARTVAHRDLMCGPNRHLTLNDLRDMKIQPQQSVVAFRDMLADPVYRSRKLAFVAAPTLARSQLMRALNGREAKCFEDIASAETWLFADDLDDVGRLPRTA
ncbi:hypothetical protein [Sphingomonas sp. AX6]|uniref:hypothetical protein n=1 Tax=Sphingomonas sp. AX6 TaxID=2653171 RepID=UPI0012F2F2F2|nr:hypothetical protein [Sphingomonas sp. AX6]VXC43347.1 conserved hypothetical protein [Sphingomonas sp. AX6]